MGYEPAEIKNQPAARRVYAELSSNKTAKYVQLFFDAHVLDRYREQSACKIIRTDTTGRLSKKGVWNVDFGISGDHDGLIHIAADSFIQRLPETEHAHWLDHMLTLPTSDNYLKGLLRPGCLDDGEIREW